MFFLKNIVLIFSDFDSFRFWYFQIFRFWYFDILRFLYFQIFRFSDFEKKYKFMFHKKIWNFKFFFSVPPFFLWRRFYGVVLCVLRSFIVFYNPLRFALLIQSHPFYTVFLWVYAHYSWRRFLTYFCATIFTPLSRAPTHTEDLY